MLIDVDANALTTPPLGVALSQEPPDMVEVTAVKWSEPPPAFDTESARVLAADFCTNEKVNEPGLTFRLGAPGAVVVRVTPMDCVYGCASAAVMVTVPE